MKKKESRPPNSSNFSPRASAASAVGDGVGQREGDLLHRGRARLADVVAGDGDRVPARQVLVAVGEDVADDAQRGRRRVDVGAAGDVLLEQVVLDRAGQSRRDRRPAAGPRRCRSASRIAAVELIVIEVETWSSGMPSNSSSMSSSDEIATPTLPTSPVASVVVGVVAHLRRQVEGHREAGLALLQQVAVALVGLLGGAEAGVLAHGPEAAAVHGRLHAAGEGMHARVAEPPSGPIPRDRRRCRPARRGCRRSSRTARGARAPWRASWRGFSRRLCRPVGRSLLDISASSSRIRRVAQASGEQ